MTGSAENLLSFPERKPDGGATGTVLIFTCDRPEDLARCLESVSRQTVRGWPRLVVDNGGNPRTDHILEQDGARVIKDGTKKLSYLFNLGWRNASDDLIAYLADDVAVDPVWLEEGLRSLAARPDAALVTGPLTSPTALTGEMHRLHDVAQRNALLRPVLRFYNWLVMDGRVLEPAMLCDSGAHTMGQAFVPDFDEDRDVDLATTTAMIIRRSAIEAVGGFDENFMFNHADGDLFVRLKRKGYKIVYNPRMRAVHYTRMGPSRHAFFIGRDTAVFYLKDIRPRTWKGRVGFVVNVLVLNLYWIYNAVRTRDIGQLKGISGFFKGILDYIRIRRKQP